MFSSHILCLFHFFHLSKRFHLYCVIVVLRCHILYLFFLLFYHIFYTFSLSSNENAVSTMGFLGGSLVIPGAAPVTLRGKNPMKRWRVVGEPPRSSWTENLSWYYASANPLGEPPRSSWIEPPYHGTTKNLSLFWFVGHAYQMLVTTTTTMIYFLKSVYFFPQRTRKGLLWTFIECKCKCSNSCYKWTI